MSILTRRSVIRSSVGFAAAGALARPYIANAAAKTAEVWWVQGFVKEEDVAFKKMVDDYEKQSGNKIEQSITPYAALRQKEIAAIQTGVVPDVMEIADFALAPLQSWDDRLTDITDVVEPVKDQFIKTALSSCYYYNNVTKKRAFYVAPMKIAAVPFHIWKSLVEKGGQKISDLPNTWDAFMDFFKPVQDGLRKQGMRNVYALGYQITAKGGRPDQHLQCVDDRQWRAEPGHRRRQAPHGRSGGEAGLRQGARQPGHPVQAGLRPAGLRQLERCRRQQRVPLETDGHGFRRYDLDRGRAAVDGPEGRFRGCVDPRPAAQQ